jgi:amidase
VRDLLFRPALELAELVRSGEVSSRELVQASLEACESVDGELNAFNWIDADGALEAANAVKAGDERPFAGVPFAVKDIAPMAGKPFTMGSDLFGDFAAPHDAFAIRRLRGAGFVIVGQTSVPEFGIVNVTESRRYGPARNPWNPERTPGGSSGGAAAAVAAGAVPVAHGTDGGGSIRIPAACCGLVGLKPTRGRVSWGPDLGESFLVVHGSLTRSVADTAAILDVLAGYEPGDATWAPPPAEPFVDSVRRDPGRLRVGVTTVAPIAAELDPLQERAVRDAAELLESLGHSVEEIANPPWAEGDLLPIFMKLWCVGISLGVVFGAAVTGREPTAELVEPLTWWLYEQAQELKAPEYAASVSILQSQARSIVSLHSEYDVLLVPALGQRPVQIGEIDTCGPDPPDEFRKSGRFTPHTALFNVTGQPSIALPLYHGDDGLPLAVQLVGPPAREDLLLQVSAQLEEASPWAGRRAPLTAAA